MKTMKMLTSTKKKWIRGYCKDNNIRLNLKALEAIVYLLRTGCQWRLLPAYYGCCQTIYHLYRSWTARKWFRQMLRKLLHERRILKGRKPNSIVAIYDSQSVRSGISSSEKGVDGNKRIKGIKRHLAVESDGLPLEIVVTRANVHDSRAAYPLSAHISLAYPSITLIKADNGYKGALNQYVKDMLGIEMHCVKSNYGSSDFIPLEGLWVVERTISWLDNYRRLCLNYEKTLRTAECIAIAGMFLILIRSI